MDNEYHDLSLKEREKIHEDIERIRQVLQTDPDDLYADEDEDQQDDGDTLRVFENVQPMPRNSLTSQLTDHDHEGSVALNAVVGFTALTPAKGTYIERINTPLVRAPPAVTADYTEQDEQEQEGEFEEDNLPANAAVALALNRAYQEVIEENLKRIKLVLIHNRERQSQLQQEIQTKDNTDLYCNDLFRRKQLSVYSIPYFKDIEGMHPPVNEDAVIKVQSGEADPFIKPRKTFTKEQLTKLRQGVLADTKHKLMIPITSKKEILYEKMSLLTKDQEQELQDFKTTIYQLDCRIQEIKHLGLKELLDRRGEDVDKIDWLKISTIDFDGQRTAEELEITWKHLAHPKINTGKFRANEDNMLLTVAAKHDFTDWQSIADELGTCRTPFQCLQRYQMKLNPVLKTGKWTAEEDNILKEVVDQCRLINGDIDWTNVSYFMEGRSFEMCQQRWVQVNPELANKKGRWTQAEDMKMLTALQIYGTQWAKLEKYIPNRSQVQIRERYYNGFNNFKHGDWTYEEDRYIWMYVMEHGSGRWAALARDMPGRSDSTIKIRYKRLVKWAEISSSLGNTKIDSLDVLLRATCHSVRTELNKAQILKKKAQRQIKKEKGIKIEDDFLDKTLMFKEVVDKGNVPQEELDKNKQFTDVVQGELQRFYKEQDQLVLIKPHKTVAEKQREKILNNKIEEDIKQGIFIPRPPPGVETSRTYTSLLSKKVTFQNMMKERIIKSILQEGRDVKDVPVISKTVDGMFRGEVSPHLVLFSRDPTTNETLGAMDQLKLKSIGKMLTVKEIIDLSSTLKNSAIEAHGMEPEIEEEQEVEDQIGKLLCTKTAEYQPGKFTNENRSEDERLKQTLEMKTRVSRLMFAALNIDVKGSVTNAEAIRSGVSPKSWASRKPYTQNADAIESNIDKLSAVSMTPIRHVIPSPMIDSCLSTPVEEPDTESDVNTPGQKKKSIPRIKALTGEESVMYRIPPLPPSYNSINAFKSLLLRRKKLIKAAGRFHLPGSLTTGKVVKKDKKSNIKLTSRFLLPDINQSVMVKNLDSIHLGFSPFQTGLYQVANNVESSQQISTSQEQPQEETSSQQQTENRVTPQASTSKVNFFPTEEIEAKDIEQVAREKAYTTKELLMTKKVVESEHLSAFERGEMSVEEFDAISNGLIVEKKSTVKKIKLRALEKLRRTHDYQLLNGRLRSIFLWPALLSTIPVAINREATTGKSTGGKKDKLSKTKKRRRKRKARITTEEVTDGAEGESPMKKERPDRRASQSGVDEAGPSSVGGEQGADTGAEEDLMVVSVKKRGRPRGKRLSAVPGQKPSSPRSSRGKRLLNYSEVAASGLSDYDDSDNDEDYKPEEKKSKFTHKLESVKKKRTSKNKKIELRKKKKSLFDQKKEFVKAYLDDYVPKKYMKSGRFERKKKKGLEENSVPQIPVTGVVLPMNNLGGAVNGEWNGMGHTPQNNQQEADGQHGHTPQIQQQSSAEGGCQDYTINNNLQKQTHLNEINSNTLHIGSNNEGQETPLVPCIMIGDQLIPINHPLLADLVKTVKAMSAKSSGGVGGEPIGSSEGKENGVGESGHDTDITPLNPQSIPIPNISPNNNEKTLPTTTRRETLMEMEESDTSSSELNDTPDTSVSVTGTSHGQINNSHGDGSRQTSEQLEQRTVELSSVTNNDRDSRIEEGNAVMSER